MPDSPTTEDPPETDKKIPAFQRYLVEDRKLADQYQQVIDKFVEECRTHNPGMTADTENALEQYFVTYIARGADPALIDRQGLGSKQPDEIEALEKQIPDKLSQPSRDRFEQLGKERSADALWDHLFTNGDDIVIPLPTESKSLRERIDDEITKHNVEADKQYQTALGKVAKDRDITVEALQEIMRGDPRTMSLQDRALLSIGKDPSQIRVRIQPEAKLKEYTGQTNKWESSRKFNDVLQQGDLKNLSDAIAVHNTDVEKRYQNALEQARNERGMTLAELQAKLPKIMQGDEKKMSPEDIKLRNILRDAKQGKLCIWTEDQLQEYDRQKGEWKPGRKLSKLLGDTLQDEYNNLASNIESLQKAMRPPAQETSTIPIPYGEVGTRADEYDPSSMRVVISRNPQRIGESSSGQAWFSCMSEKGINFHYLDHDIKQGTIIAYLVSKDDPLARRPLARMFCKSYTDPDTKETILVPGKAYGGQDDYTAGRRQTLSPKVKAAFQEAVMEWVREKTHQGKKGTFALREGLYADGELTTQMIKDSWTQEEVLAGLKGFRSGLIQEFLTEHYTKQNNVDAMIAGKDKETRQRELNAEYTRKIEEFEDPVVMGKAYLRKLKKSSLGAIPIFDQVTTATQELDASVKVAVGTLGSNDAGLVMKYNLFEVRLGHAPDEELVKKAIDANPAHAFSTNFRDVMVGQPWSADVVKAAAILNPDLALSQSKLYADQTWGKDVVEIAAKKVSLQTALRYADRFITEPYAKDVITAAAGEEPGKALEYASQYAGEIWSGKVLEMAAKNASPQDALQFADRFITEPYAKDVITAAAGEEPGKALEYASQYAGERWSGKILEMAAKNAPPQTALYYADRFKTEPYAKDVIKAAAQAATPEDALYYLDYYKNEHYARDIMIEVANSIPDKTLERAGFFADQPWVDDVLKIAAKKASHEAVVRFAPHYIGKPFAKDVFTAMAQESPEKAVELEHVYADQPWAGDIQQIAAKHAMESKSIPIDAKIHLAAKYADHDWAAKAIIKLYQDADSHNKPVLAILQIADRLEGHPWAEPIFADIINEYSYEVTAYAHKVLDQKATPRLVEQALDRSPFGISNIAKLVGPPWVEDLLKKTLQNNPGRLLAHSDDYKHQPFATSLTKEAVDRALEVSPRVVMERISLFENEPWAKDAIRQAAIKLSRDDEHESRSLLLKNADRIAGEDYGKDIIIAAAKKSPAEALAYSEKFSQEPWAEQVLTDAVKTIMGRSYGAGVLPHADRIKGKEFKHKRFLLGTRPVTGEELIERDAARDPHGAITYADQYSDIPKGPRIIGKALGRVPGTALHHWSSSDDQWHAEPWADPLLEKAHRNSIKYEPEDVLRSLHSYAMGGRKWKNKLIEKAGKALARQDPEKLLELVAGSSVDEVPAYIVQDAYKRLKRRDPEAARQYEGLQALSDTSSKTGSDAVQSTVLSDDSPTHGQSHQDTDLDGAQEGYETHHHRNIVNQQRSGSQPPTSRPRRARRDMGELVGTGTGSESSWEK